MEGGDGGMVKLLVINCGSSSIKFKLFGHDGQGGLAELAGGGVSAIGSPNAELVVSSSRGKTETCLDISDHRSGLKAVLGLLQDPEQGIIKEAAEITMVGHRTVHGGDKFSGAVAITPEVINEMAACIPLAPIHNPANLAGIRVAMEMLPRAGHVAVFDTAFHQSLPAHVYLYGLPYELYQDHGIRRYGFHGTSCQYVLGRAAEMARRSAKMQVSEAKAAQSQEEVIPADKAPVNTAQATADTRVIICHIGNGVSVTAVKNGRSVDTSTGLTPLEGAMMGTRCGDLDPGVLLHLQRHLGMTADQVDELLNHRSGLLGISGRSNDMRQLLAAADAGDARCSLAIEVYAYRIRKYIGAYAAAMGGIDILIFTGGVGENSPVIREKAVRDLGFMGIALDPDLNAGARQDTRISLESGPVSVFMIRTNEELMIALQTLAVCRDKK